MFLLLQVQSLNFPFGSIAPAAINDNVLFVCFQPQDVDCPSFLFNLSGSKHCFYLFCSRFQAPSVNFKCVKFRNYYKFELYCNYGPFGPWTLKFLKVHSRPDAAQANSGSDL